MVVSVGVKVSRNISMQVSVRETSESKPSDYAPLHPYQSSKPRVLQVFGISPPRTLIIGRTATGVEGA